MGGMSAGDAPPSENVTNDPEAEELKNELQRLVLEVIGGNQEDNDGNKVDHGVGNINKAIKALTALKELHLGEKKLQHSSLYDHLDVPVEFRCPISKEMMRDPAVLSTGQGTRAIRGIFLDIKQPLKDVPIEIINWYAFRRYPSITTAFNYLFEKFKNLIRQEADENDNAILHTRSFEKMKNLKLLQINYSQLRGNMKYMPSVLRCLQSRGCYQKALSENIPVYELSSIQTL
ncbi:uncharacterized protein LOC141626747 [Silene latifolia]|uniref:uncharacterized protein LOC141626747 n=1 Tax=Silene latifolia TaxID=37657 RepID=UPI003D76C958